MIFDPITRNGKVVAKLTDLFQERVDMTRSLFGSVPSDMALDETREEIFVLFPYIIIL